MKRSDFHFDLPDELIARYPQKDRSASRLLCLNKQSGAISHRIFRDVRDLLNPGDLLVMNNTKVIPARLFGQKATGGQLEILVERVLSDQEVLAHIRSSRSPKPGSRIIIGENNEAEMLQRKGQFFHLKILGERTIWEVMDECGHMPLPPYIDRADENSDFERYQTVYAQHAGAVAAPTAGLHFDQELLDALAQKGVEVGFATLHVGAGTFQPVKVDDIKEHEMHSEYLEVSKELCEQVQATKARGNRVVAVGTTSVRCLETAATNGQIAPFTGDTDIFIYPGYEFKVVDALITNFHLPESTLIMLVSAMAGREPILAAYKEAVEQQYRFFSYGDAMFISDIGEGAEC